MTLVRLAADEEDGRCAWCDEPLADCRCFDTDAQPDLFPLWPSPDPHDQARELRLSAGRGVETVAWL